MGIFRNDGDNGPEDDSSDAGDGVRVVPLLPLRDSVVLPHMVVPLFVGRPRSIQALDEA